jgi:hypothetical protein
MPQATMLEVMVRTLPATASMSHDAMGNGGEKMEAMAAQNTVKLALEPAAPLEAGKTARK